MSEQRAFNPDLYWASRNPKKWVVRLESSKDREIRYVSAKNQNGAIKAAKAVTGMKGNLSYAARLATPKDLGANYVT